MPPENLTDVLNALLAAGYVEQAVSRTDLDRRMPTTEFEANPSYVHELRESMKRSWF